MPIFNPGNVDFWAFPQNRFSPPNDFKKLPSENQYTIGDLHGNALQLIWSLIYSKLLVLHEDSNESKKRFAKLVAIYNKPVNSINADDLAEFEAILNEAAFHKDRGMMRLIGDEVFDRGSNDYFTLLVFEKLSIKKVPTEILLSNHGEGFLQAQTSKPPVFNHRGHSYDSLSNLKILIDKGLVSQDRVTQIINKHYKPLLQGITYTVDKECKPPKISIFTHAPYGFETIKELAKAYKIPYCIDDINALCHMLDMINAKMREDIEDGSIHKKLDAEDNRIHEEKVYESPGNDPKRPYIPSRFPFTRAIWNRSKNDPEMKADNFPSTLGSPGKEFSVDFTCGHLGYPHQCTGVDKNIKNLWCIDSFAGRPHALRASSDDKNWYVFPVVFSQDAPAKKQLEGVLSRYAVTEVIGKYWKYREKYFIRLFFGSDETRGVITKLRNAKNGEQRYRIASEYVKAYPKKRFSMHLLEILEGNSAKPNMNLKKPKTRGCWC